MLLHVYAYTDVEHYYAAQVKSHIKSQIKSQIKSVVFDFLARASGH